MIFGLLDLEISYDEHRPSRKIVNCRDEKNHPYYLFINPYALILYLNESVGILHKIIAIITKLQIKQKHNDNSTSNKGAQNNL
jgi:hypothetical protein